MNCMVNLACRSHCKTRCFADVVCRAHRGRSEMLCEYMQIHCTMHRKAPCLAGRGAPFFMLMVCRLTLCDASLKLALESVLSKNTASSHGGPASRKASRGSRKPGRQASEVFRRCGLQRAWHTNFPGSWDLAFPLPGSFPAGKYGKHAWKAEVLFIICQRPPLSEIVLASSLDS